MVIKKTKSLCPECLRVVDAEVFDDQEKILIRKTCPEHGEFENTYWQDRDAYLCVAGYDYEREGIDNPRTSIEGECPLNCGICPEHESQTVLGLIDITNRCNLRCPVCFANAAVSNYLYEPSYEEIRSMLRNLRANQPVPTPAIQYAGGEPTIRKDIVELVKLARDEGFSHIQIATNGIKLAKDPELAQKLKDATLNTVYLQFDGVTEEPYIKSRGRNLLPTKLEAIENCRKADLGIVLVPTLVKGVNEDQIGDIIRFAIENLDIIRGVNFQPVSFSGRTPADQVEKQRITIPLFQKLVDEQTRGKIGTNDFYPASSIIPVTDFVEAIEGENQVAFTCHPHCGTATYIFIDNDDIVPITRFLDVDRFFSLLSRSSNDMKGGGFMRKAKVLKRARKELPKTINGEHTPDSLDITSILTKIFKQRSYSALGDFHHKTLLISCMHFMDPWNFDRDRVRKCLIHYAVPDGRIIPFCSMNSIYREQVEKKFSKPLKKNS